MQMSKAGFPVFLKNPQKHEYTKKNNTETQTHLLKPTARISKIVLTLLQWNKWSFLNIILVYILRS